MQTEIISTDSPSAIAYAVNVLNNGGIVAFPTDTVYGLAAPVCNEEAIDRLYVVKGRKHTKAIAVLMSKVEQSEDIAAEINDQVRELAARFLPGPLTLVLPRHPSLPNILAPTPTIGVRIPNHPVALALMDETGPLAVTSANLSGQDNTTTAQEVMAQLKGRIHLIVDGGQTPGGVPSTVIDCTSKELKILREGPLSAQDLNIK
jgi:L-threonylcarbamoyladenylate synthase